MTSSRPTWDDSWMAMARVIAQRSLCDRDRVGAVVVSASNRIIDTGYNGPPAGFTRHHTVDENKVGCTMWCGRARLSYDNIMQRKRLGNIGAFEEPLAQDYSDCPSLHAEANALMFSDRRLREGGTIYVSSGTCSGCAKLVANSGLARAVYASSDRADGASHRDSERWYDFLRDCGLEVVTC